MRLTRQVLAKVAVCLLFVFCYSQIGNGYSVLTHEEIIDLLWKDQLRPLLDRIALQARRMILPPRNPRSTCVDMMRFYANTSAFAIEMSAPAARAAPARRRLPPKRPLASLRCVTAEPVLALLPAGTT